MTLKTMRYIKQMSLKIKKLDKHVNLPKMSTTQSAGYDLESSEHVVIMPGRRAAVSTGLAIQMPEGVYGRIAPRSGLAVKHGLQVGAGVVDRDYTGEIKVVLFNHDKKPFVIKPEYRIAQLILERHETLPVEEVDDISDTDRGEGGFGSTGV